MVTLAKSFSMAGALTDIILAIALIVLCFLSEGAMLVLLIVATAYVLVGFLFDIALYRGMRKDGHINFWVCTVELAFGFPFGTVGAVLALVIKDRRGDAQESLPFKGKGDKALAEEELKRLAKMNMEDGDE